MKYVNFILAVLAIIIALGAAGLAMRGLVFTRFAFSSWNSWAVTEQSDAVIVDTGGAARNVTVCNRSFRRDEERNAVIVETSNGGQVSSHVLNHRGCISVSGDLIAVKKREGESFAARGRYKLERGSRRGRMMGSRSTRMIDQTADGPAASSDESPNDGTAEATESDGN